MASIYEALALNYLASDPSSSVVTLPSGWNSFPAFFPGQMLPKSGLQIGYFVNSFSHEITIVFQSDINTGAGFAIDAAAEVVNYFALQGGLTIQAETDGLNYVKNVASNNVGAPIFLTGTGIGATVAEYVMQQLTLHPISGTSVSGMAFGGFGLPGTTATSNFTSYINPIDINAFSPYEVNHEGTIVPLTPTLGDTYGGAVVNALEKLAHSELLGKLFSETVENTIGKVGDLTDYATTLLSNGIITYNPLVGASKIGKLIDDWLNLKSVVSGITGYTQSTMPSGNILDAQAGTIIADGITQNVSLTNYTDGTAQLIDMESSGVTQAREVVNLSSKGMITSNQLLIQSTTVSTGNGETCDIGGSVDGSLVGVFFSPGVSQSDLEYIGSSDGTSSLEGVNSASGVAQEVIGFAAGSTTGDTLSVNSDSFGNQNSTLEIQTTTPVEVIQDSSVSGYGQTFSFTGGGETLKIDQTAPFAGTIANFVVGETIDLADLGIGFHSLNYNATSRSLTIVRLDNQIVTLNFTNNITDFRITSDGASGAFLTTDTPAEQAVAGASPNETAISGSATSPFASLTVTDPNANQTETVTVTMSVPANGAFSNLAGGIYDSVAGVYTVTGSDSIITAALEGLIFTPSAGAEGLNALSLSVVDTTGATVGLSSTVVTVGHAYTWSGPVSGSWDAAGNWDDVTAGANPAGVAPGSNDSVTVNALGSGETQVITGVGASASLTLNGGVVLGGQFTAGSVSFLMNSSTSYATGSLTLSAGETLSVASNFTLSATNPLRGAFDISVGGLGVKLSVGGVLAPTLLDDLMTYTVSASNGGAIQARGLTLISPATINVDATSSIEVGTSGGASAGAFTVDAGATASISFYSLVNAPTINNAGSITSSDGNNTTAGTVSATTINNSGSISDVNITATVVNNTGTLTLIGDTMTALVVDNGIITASAAYGNPAKISGSVSGTGQIQIAAAASLALQQVAAGIGVSFTGEGGTLSLGPGSLDASKAFDPVIQGFDPSDVIDFTGTVTSAAYAGGTLTLLDGSTTVATLRLSGNYAGATFITAPTATTGVTQVSLSTGGNTPTAPPGTTTADAYTWSGPVSGSWDAAGNWEDVTAGANPAGVAPGSNDSVTVNALGSGETQVITGVGASASLTLNGGVVLGGQFTAGSVSFLMNSSTSYATGSLTLSAGETLSVASNFTLSATNPLRGAFDISVSGLGGKLSVGGVLAPTLLDYLMTYTVSASNGGAIQARGLTLISPATINVDATSSIEVGTSGGASAGAFTVDAGATASISFYSLVNAPTINNAGSITSSDGNNTTAGTVSATTINNSGSISDVNITATVVNNTGTLTLIGDTMTALVVDNGIITASAAYGNPAKISGSVSGTGQIQIAAAASLALQQVAAGIGVSFTGEGGTLSLGPGSLDASKAFDPVIQGFDPSDVIDFTGTVTSAAYAGGTLTLLDGSTTVATLRLSGNYAGATFITAPTATTGVTQVSLSTGGNTPTAPPGTTTADAYTWSGPVSGSWDAAGNWEDVTAGANPAGVAPGSNDSVTVNALGSGETQVITGVGASASLTLNGGVVLGGQFTAGSVSFLMNSSTSYATGSLTLSAGETLSVASNFTLSATNPLRGAFDISVSGLGGKLSVGGVLAPTLLDDLMTYTVSASNGGAIQARGLTLISPATINVDATSSIE